MEKRLKTGIPQLDEALGGGLLPGCLTMIVGATGVGKTQLGIQFSEAGLAQEGSRGAVIDLSSRGDSQNHVGYAQRLFSVDLSVGNLKEEVACPFGVERPSDLLSFLGYGGRRVLRSQMDDDQWHAWQSELNRRTPQLFKYVYSHLTHGTRRFIVDGIEPQVSASDSLQLDLLELIYHRMLRQEHDWLAREVLRENYREWESKVAQHAFDHQASSAVVLVTTKQTMLEQLMTDPLADGDLLAGANTIIMLGRQLKEGVMTRALYVAKHRGSYADQRIIPFEITEQGVRLP
ncbi:circadian clock protein KaiC [Aureliella helgolandensis]|uniref:Circadian clock protein KaiC n=1 Tax=Aureliella helgolandensis TaxID=2527968 RepID=A0A518G831_9BACT|nr:circadian clock protein KaiC [Aureliella helgolandensis]